MAEDEAINLSLLRKVNASPGASLAVPITVIVSMITVSAFIVNLLMVTMVIIYSIGGASLPTQTNEGIRP
jgi:uncharacterized membrane protein YwzB